MLFMMLILILMLSLLDQAVRRGRTDMLIQGTRFRLFEIRDILREAAINAHVSAENPLFKYLDTSLSKTARNVSEINVTGFLKRFAAGEIRFRMGDEHVQALNRLHDDLQKPGNEKFAEVHRMYSECLGDFIAHRHPILLRVLIRGLFFVLEKNEDRPRADFDADRFDEMKISQAQRLTVDRHFSTFPTYCNQH